MKNGDTTEKAPNDKLDYTFRWKNWLDKKSDTIASSEVTVDSGITLVTDTNDTESATAWVSGGQDGCTYKVTNKITTANSEPRIKEAWFFIKVIDPETNNEKAYQ